jgi:hypothetical protein
VADGGITGMSLRDVRKLIKDENMAESALDVVDDLLGAVIVLSPMVIGPAALALLPLLEVKDQFVRLGKDAIKAITKSQASDYLDKAKRLAAANCLLTFTAYFDALNQLLPGLMNELGLTDELKRRIAAEGAASPVAEMPTARPLAGQQEVLRSFQGADLTSQTIAVPHPVELDDARAARLALYQAMSKTALGLLAGFDAWERLPEGRREHAQELISERVPDLASSVYEAEYLGMAIDFPQFFVWSVLRDQQEKDVLIKALVKSIGGDIKTVGADLRIQFELVASALMRMDLGLARLAAAIREIPPTTGGSSLRSDLGQVAESLHLMYEHEVRELVIDDRFEADNGKPRLVYPRKVDCYVPQAYRLARYTDETVHLEREDEWRNRPFHDDLGPFLMRHLESPYSVETPLLILGHPGSGKSLLTEVIAARLAYPQYTTVRVALRDVNPDLGIEAQIEAQIHDHTGRKVDWVDFAQNLAMSPPVVILDGYDELLQATGKLFTDYLLRVEKFQRREALNSRPVRVIVTSRVTLIDKAVVPPGTTIVRLAEFDNDRRAAWTAVWNSHNQAYFTQSEIRPFALPANDKIIELAEQPLLLLMLAIYDAIGNQLSARPDIDRTQLYHELLTRFIVRELSKGTMGFAALQEAERRAETDREMEHLGVAAVGMFNRQDVKIRRDDLNRDLRYFKAERGSAADGFRRMSGADLLLGSFFFVHESRSRLPGGSAEAEAESAALEFAPDQQAHDRTAGGSASPVTGPAAFEFLHNTFGEFLAADFILRRVLAEADAVCALSGNAVQADTLRQRLSSVSPSWFACLTHTPLHTRPNILALMREWGSHRLSQGTRPRQDLLGALDQIIVTQLRALLAQTPLPDLSARESVPAGESGVGEKSPYDPLPALGHLAVYSLNLILLRCYLEDGTYLLDEDDLGGRQIDGCRPWDRLVNIWRSWFPLESLGALASVLTATRDETRIAIKPAAAPLAVPNASSLYTAYNVAVALADDLTAASAGMHVASLLTVPGAFLDDLRARAQVKGTALIPLIDSMLPRLSATSIERLPDLLPGVPGNRLLAGKSAHVPPYMLNLVELADRLMISPRQRARVDVGPSELMDLAGLSRYEAELAVHVRNELEPRWLAHLLLFNPVSGERSSQAEAGQLWRRFLLSPAAAPALRAGVRCLDRAMCVQIAAGLASESANATFETFDVDTAAALIVLSWRGGQVGLCERSLDEIMRACEGNVWHLLDIPTETWGGLADIFVPADFAATGRRARFTALLEPVIAQTLEAATSGHSAADQQTPTDGDAVTALEFWINALRIGASARREDILDTVFGVISASHELVSLRCRGWVTLLMRWAHETKDRELALDLFTKGHSRLKDTLPWQSFFEVLDSLDPAEFDVEQMSSDLTYREAQDLNWVVQVLQQSGVGPPDARSDRVGRRTPPTRRTRNC